MCLAGSADILVCGFWGLSSPQTIEEHGAGKHREPADKECLRYPAKHILRQSRRLEMMNGSKPDAPSGGFQAPSPKRKRSGLRVSCSPSPQPSPQGEGETFPRALVIRPSLVVVCPRNERQRSGDGNRNLRIFLRPASALPLLGERVGVRGNEANSNHQSHDDSRNSQTSRVPPAEPGGLAIWL